MAKCKFVFLINKFKINPLNNNSSAIGARIIAPEIKMMDGAKE